MKKNWIDFKEIKDNLSFERVLEHYNIQVTKAKGNELSGKCPFHQDDKPSFRVNTEKKIFHCFGCEAKGNVLDFVAKMENVSIKKAGLLVQEWFSMAGAEKASYNEDMSVKNEPKTDKLPEKEEIEPNKPLTFSLKLDYEHPYLRDRGLDKAQSEYFEVGFCNRGFLKDRIAIALRDDQGQLVGYAGRWIAGEIPKGEDKYKFPPDLKKSLLLYNIHRIKGSDHLVVVEGFFSVFRLNALGIPAVALMGCSVSDAQEKLLVESGYKYITLLLDGDKPGREAQERVLQKFAKKFFVYSAELPDGTEPDTIEQEKLFELLRTEKK